MHLLVSPLCAPPEYVERFAFIRERYDDPDHARQYVAAMTSLLDDIVGDVVAALHSETSSLGVRSAGRREGGALDTHAQGRGEGRQLYLTPRRDASLLSPQATWLEQRGFFTSHADRSIAGTSSTSLRRCRSCRRPP